MTAIHFGDEAVPANFVRDVFLPHVVKLASLREISDGKNILRIETEWGSLFAAWSAAPCSQTLQKCQLFVCPTAEGLAALQNFPQLEMFRFQIDTNAQATLCQQLPPSIRTLSLYSFGMGGVITESAQSAIAGLNIDNLFFENRTPQVNQRLFELLAASPSLRTVTLAGNFRAAPLVTDLAPLATSKSLHTITLLPGLQGVFDVEKLAEALPRLRVQGPDGRWQLPRFEKRLPPVGELLDLLPLLEPNIHSRNGLWRQRNSTLHSPAIRHASLELPVQPAAAYRIEALMQRISGSDSFAFALPTAKGNTLLVLDGDSGKSGLDFLDGKPLAGQADAHTGQVLTTKKFCRIVIDVSPGSIHAVCDGQTVVDWQGNNDRLRVNEELAKQALLTPGALSLIAYESPFRIARLSYTALPTP